MAINKDIKYFLLNSCLTRLVFYLLTVYTKTLHVRFEGVDAVRRHLDGDGRVVIVSWHQRFFGGFYLPKIFNWSPCIMISQSRDGDFIADVVRRIGWIPVRGSSSRGGRQALQDMIEGVVKHRIGGHIVDGPQGPPRIIKPGIISLARHAGAIICPGLVSYEKYWTFNSWDRFMIPKPFSRVLFRMGSIHEIPVEAAPDQLELYRKKLEENLAEEYKEADRYWEKIRGIKTK